MAKTKATGVLTHTSVHKRTQLGGNRVKTSSMNKSKRRNFKKSRGQGG